MWQEIAVFAIVGGAAWNLWRTLGGSFGGKSGCDNGCGKCASNPSQTSTAPLIQIQMNGRALQMPTKVPRDEQTIGRN